MARFRHIGMFAALLLVMSSCGAGNSAFSDTFGQAESVVYFVRYEHKQYGDSPLDLFALSLPSQEERQITFGAKVRQVVQAPDGQSLLYLDAKADRTATPQLVRSNLDGTDPVEIGDMIRASSPLHVSPDGKSVIYASDATGPEVVTAIDLATGESRVVASPELRATYPIGFAGDHLIYLDLDKYVQKFVRIDFATGQVLASLEFYQPYFQQIAPDGSEMIVGTTDGELFRVDLGQTEMVAESLGAVTDSPRDLFISPDGERYGFNSRSEIFVGAAADPTTLFELFAGRAGEELPLWTADSQSIVYASGDLWDRTIHLAAPNPAFASNENPGLVSEDLGIRGLPVLATGPN